MATPADRSLVGVEGCEKSVCHVKSLREGRRMIRADLWRYMLQVGRLLVQAVLQSTP
jgi:hypothetical protein